MIKVTERDPGDCQCGCVQRRAKLSAALAFDCGFDSAKHRAAWAQVLAEVARDEAVRAEAEQLNRPYSITTFRAERQIRLERLVLAALAEYGALTRVELGGVLREPIDEAVICRLVDQGRLVKVGRLKHMRYLLAPESALAEQARAAV